MYEFEYHRADALTDATDLFGRLDEPSYLAGGHTLLPTMKNRLAAPENLIDVSAVPELQGIARDEGVLRIGAATTHRMVATSGLVQDAIPALAALAGSIGDVQVRQIGTIGGSVANNDPSADYPSAVLALAAEIETDRRVIPAKEYFDGLYATDLQPGELVVSIRFPIPDLARYAKYRNPASRYALAGVFVARTGRDIRVAVTGAGQDGVFRWSEAEAALRDDFSAAALDGCHVDPDAMMADMHASAAFRAHLVKAVAKRAVVAETSDIV